MARNRYSESIASQRMPGDAVKTGSPSKFFSQLVTERAPLRVEAYVTDMTVATMHARSGR